MDNLNDCPHCGLPVEICSCSYPDAIYNAADMARTEPFINREVSPAEGLSDYTKTRSFVDAFLYGRRSHGFTRWGIILK